MTSPYRRWRLLGRWRQNEKGTTAVEMAFVFPVFASLVFGVVEFGRALQIYNQIAHAASEASRTVMIDRTISNTTIQANLGARLNNLDPGRLTIMTSDDTAGGRLYKVISLTYEYQFFLNYILPMPVTLAADASALID